MPQSSDQQISMEGGIMRCEPPFLVNCCGCSCVGTARVGREDDSGTSAPAIEAMVDGCCSTTFRRCAHNCSARALLRAVELAVGRSKLADLRSRRGGLASAASAAAMEAIVAPSTLD